MHKPTFDRLKLSIPSECLKIIDDTVFTITSNGDGCIIRMRYEQTSPFFYSIAIEYSKQTAEVEFNGKALLEDYPNLINYTNISNCFENINRCGICFINSDQALQTAYVKQCDVTCDISSPYPIKDLYTTINLNSSKKWCIRDTCSNRFTIENTNTTKRCKCRMVVYDKSEEMSRKSNVDFLRSVSNPEDQLDYFKNKIRIELNLNSVDRTRRYFEVSDTKLTTLLHSDGDPIARFLKDALHKNDPLQYAAHLSGNLRELEHLLLLAAYNYDSSKVELAIRSLYGQTRSITRTRKPYDRILLRLKEAIPEPGKNPVSNDITSHLKYMLSLLTQPNGKVVPSLLNLYESATPITPLEEESIHDSLFNLNPRISSYD